MIKEKLLIFKEEKIDVKNTIYILLLIMVISGIFGFVYETFFYRIDLGYFVKRGSTYGPWIPIYAFGGLFITLTTYRFRKNPFLVFFISCLVAGILEYGTGWVLYEWLRIRLWDYNTEIWNFGNINGYICLRSILFFGMSSLLLVYAIVPAIKKIAIKIPQNWLAFSSILLGSLFAIDIVLYGLIK